MADYLRPTDLDEALAALAARPRTVLAGGTDLYPAHVDRPFAHDVLDVTAIAGLRGINRTAEGWRIGAATTWTDLCQADLPPLFDGLKSAARAVGGVQVQNAGTLVGNLCNASPAADGAPCLAAMDGEVELARVDGVRRLAIPDFLLGNRRTALAPGEMVTAIHVPSPCGGARSVFLKLGARRYLVISIAMVAIMLTTGADGRVLRAGVAVGACAATARRLPTLEARLVGFAPTTEMARLIEPGDLAPLTPIDDVRGTAAYRLDAVATLLRRGLAELADG
jgi:CO/xanthine dehydrogenase FAD-binding subunit